MIYQLIDWLVGWLVDLKMNTYLFVAIGAR